jgi:hypothetical protein
MLIVYLVPTEKMTPEETNYRLVLVENTEDDTVEFRRVDEKEYAWIILKDKRNDQ